MPTSSVLILVVAAFAATGGQLLFKIGAQGRDHWIEFLNGYIVVGLVLYAVSTLLWIYTLSFEKLINVYAFTALTFVLVLAGGVLFLGEKITAPGVIGIALVLGGLYLLTNYNG
jgi:drug/metabolite transporter (DMT)-like permease